MGLSYQQVYLKPRYSPHLSRSEIDVSVKFGHWPRNHFKVPAVPANMKCTIDTGLAEWMSANDYFYIMHRFGTKPSSRTAEDFWEDNYQFVRMANGYFDVGRGQRWKTISISVGVQQGDMELLKRCADNGLEIDFITIDIAHAHSIRMEKMLTFTNELYKKIIDKPFIIAGNVATPEAVVDVEQWGADSVKVGIAQGGACTTYGQTGFGVPMFTCMLDCSAVAKKPLIADGGIRTPGDFAKALVAGGHMVMAGGYFAASLNSPAESVVKLMRTGEVKVQDQSRNPVVELTYVDRIVEKRFKRYYGSASSINKHSNKHVEGRLVELECDDETYGEKLHYIEEHLQSAVSYAGDNLRLVKWGVLGQ